MVIWLWPWTIAILFLVASNEKQSNISLQVNAKLHYRTVIQWNTMKQYVAINYGYIQQYEWILEWHIWGKKPSLEEYLTLWFIYLKNQEQAKKIHKIKFRKVILLERKWGNFPWVMSVFYDFICVVVCVGIYIDKYSANYTFIKCVFLLCMYSSLI